MTPPDPPENFAHAVRGVPLADAIELITTRDAAVRRAAIEECIGALESNRYNGLVNFRAAKLLRSLLPPERTDDA